MSQFHAISATSLCLASTLVIISMIIGMGFMENSKKWCAVSCRTNRNNKNSDTPGYSSGSLNPLRFKLLYLKL